MLIPRTYSELSEYLIKEKVLLLFGPRQVGKTTLVSEYYTRFSGKKQMINGDNITIQEQLGSQAKDTILQMFDGYQLVIIDEAQRIPNIGIALKILIDQRKDIQVIATGSSSFSLLGQVGEPLTGRKVTLLLFPIWMGELLKLHNAYEVQSLLPEYLIYGMYPEVLINDSKQRKAQILMEITNSYLLKDILELDKVKSAKPVINLLRMLAFQVGKEVSYNELANKLGIDAKTVARYLDLFEKAYIIIRVGGFSRNLRSEITAKSKFYFFDNGIRNALIANFNALELRDDIGMLWENFLVMERIKKRNYQNIYANNYFWRTWSQQEIDILEEREGQLFGYEIVWGSKKVKSPSSFRESYPDAIFEVINQENYLEFIT